MDDTVVTTEVLGEGVMAHRNVQQMLFSNLKNAYSSYF